MSDKALVAKHAANRIEDGMVVGLGTGSTADYFIEELARRCQQEGLKVTTVASSPVSSLKALEKGLPQLAVEQISSLDLYVDGADEVTPNLDLLKGRGQDLVKEKLLARASGQFWVLVDQSKQVARIGECYPIPVEVFPYTWRAVQSQLEAMGASPTLRHNNAGIAMTSAGGVVLDTVFDPSLDTSSVNRLLNDLPGILEHGIFQQLASAVFVGTDGRVNEQWSPANRSLT